MSDQVTTITLELPLRMGTVNCYLLSTGNGLFLVDTGPSQSQSTLLNALSGLDCRPGGLRMVILTHGDFDHTGNASFLQGTFGVPIAMHTQDVGMAKFGDMFAGRRKPNLLVRVLMPLLSGFGKQERFTPDVLFSSDVDLLEYGLDARILSLPGHSPGSLGILTSQGNLFCGDLFENRHAPALNTLMDDMPAAVESLRQLQDLDIRTVFPGHGEPFAWGQVNQYLPGH